MGWQWDFGLGGLGQRRDAPGKSCTDYSHVADGMGRDTGLGYGTEPSERSFAYDYGDAMELSNGLEMAPIFARVL